MFSKINLMDCRDLVVHSPMRIVYVPYEMLLPVAPPDLYEVISISVFKLLGQMNAALIQSNVYISYDDDDVFLFVLVLFNKYNGLHTAR
jgi:hypothetical protein